MTKKLFIVCAALVWTVALVAQNISVVASDGSTIMCKTLTQAVDTAAAGSVIYLPGGGFPISDEVKITKKLTIIGIGHKTKNDNVDGVTTISGNLFFNEGSSGSAIMACYITGNVNIGEGGASVNDVLIKYCNLNSVQVLNSTCQEIVVNQNYIRGTSNFGGANAQVTNNILHSMNNIKNGFVTHNTILGAYIYHRGSVWGGGDYQDVAGIGAETTIIYNNILNSNVSYSQSQGYGSYTYVYGSGNQCRSNLTLQSGFGENSIVLEDVEWNDVFANFNGGAISPTSDFHFTDDYKQYENTVGVYADGVQFDKQLAPVPYIVAKKIDEQTDAAGRLNIKIRVKANGEE